MKKKRKYLSQEEKEEILCLHYLEGVNQSELARRFDSSKMAINRLIHNFAASNDKSVLLMKNYYCPLKVLIRRKKGLIP